MSDVFDENNHRVPSSNFFKFENVGDKVSGVLINKQRKEGQGAFPAQMIYTLKKSEGEEVKVPISETKMGTIEILDPVELGTMVGFKFSEQLKPSQPGYKGAKCIDVYVGAKQELEKVAEAPGFEDKQPETAGEPSTDNLPF